MTLAAEPPSGILRNQTDPVAAAAVLFLFCESTSDFLAQKSRKKRRRLLVTHYTFLDRRKLILMDEIKQNLGNFP